MSRPSTPLSERFAARINKGNGCWEWSGYIASSGYGTICTGPNHAPTGAHRVAWELTYGRIPTGKYVLHRCDNKACVRPSHLFIGTARDNVVDCRMKDRHCYGDRHPSHKLTWAKVRTIRTQVGKPLSFFAHKYKVSSALISKIRLGRTWKERIA